MSTITKYISEEQLKEFGWVNVNEEMIQDLNFTLERYNINTPERIRHFLSQCAHESGLGKYTKEIADGSQYEYRKDLCNTEAGYGPKYKGAGYIQLTGRCNYEKFASEMDDPRIMEGVDYVSKNYPWSSAGFWWNNNNVNKLIDSGASVEDVTRKVNGGLNGYAERLKYYQQLGDIIY